MVYAGPRLVAAAYVRPRAVVRPRALSGPSLKSLGRSEIRGFGDWPSVPCPRHSEFAMFVTIALQLTHRRSAAIANVIIRRVGAAHLSAMGKWEPRACHAREV